MPPTSEKDDAPGRGQGKDEMVPSSMLMPILQDAPSVEKPTSSSQPFESDNFHSTY